MAQDSVQQMGGPQIRLSDRGDNASVTLERRDAWWPGGALVVLAITSALAARHRVAPGEGFVFRLVNDRPATIVDPVKAFMTLGTLPGVVVIAAVVGVLTRRLGPALAVLGAGLVARITTPLLKDLVERARPAVLLDGVHVRQHPGGLGFPSAHTSVAFAVAVVIAWCFPRLRWPALAVATLVGIGRMYVGVHLPLDLLGGAALGVLAATPFVAALWLLATRTEHRSLL
jgi:undecaprenyl-diphosphatase